jgi:sec-independent protein translocase protein TatC
MATAIRPIGHEDRLSLVEHLDELRTRVVICALALAFAFGLCVWQNDRLLDFVNRPLERANTESTARGEGPLGQIAVTQRAVRRLATQDLALLAVLARPDSGLSAAARREVLARQQALRAAIARLPRGQPTSKPVTLGVGEPFGTTLTVSFYFALLLALPIILYQLYAFVLPAFSPRERRVATPLMMMIPVLFVTGVAFGYTVVLPPAVNFLQDFNADSFNVLVQARDYYRFSAIVLLALGLVFQVPVAILAATRLGVVTPAQLRSNRRYAILACAVLAMVLPGTDPVTMLLEMVPLVVLYELSILLAALFGRPKPVSDATDLETSSDAV